MDKRTVNPRLVFFLVLLVAIGIFLLYSRLSFTGYVTNVVNATTGDLLSSHDFTEGDMYNTEVLSGNVILASPKKNGHYISQVFDAGEQAIWTNFVSVYFMHPSSNYTEDPLNTSIVFSVRACNDTACTGKDFSQYSDSLSLIGQYFQYKADFKILSGNISPILSEVNISHYPPYTPIVNIESPQTVTYNNESILINISSSPGASVWFSSGVENEPYTAEVIRTFSEGAHTLNAFVSYVDGRINYTNSDSVTFTVGFLHTYYRLSNNACGAVSITNAQKTASDYSSLAECQTHVTSATTTTTTETESTQQSCAPQWECAWGECVDGVQTEECTDVSTCTTVAVPPAQRTQACTGGVTTTAEVVSTPPETTATTTETTTTTKKGFFNFVGSAIVGPVFKSAAGIIFMIVIVLAVGGFLAYKFLLKGKVKLNFFKKKRKLL